MHTYHVGENGYLVHNANVFCAKNITAVFPKVHISGLIRNRPISELSGSEIYNVFRKSGYKLGGGPRDPSHSIKRIKAKDRTTDFGFNTLGDLAAIINKGTKIDAGNGDVAFQYRGVEIIVDPIGMEIKTIKAAKRR